MGVDVLHGDCRGELTVYAPDTFDSVCTDPPYELGFMGKAWDRSGVAFDPETWRAVLRVLKPGGYMLAMGGTRTYHRLACAVEDAGFELRDCLMWMYGSGYPKGQGCLKPAWEPILLARKPGPRVLPLGIDGCRVPTDGEQVPMFMTSGGRKFEQAHTQPERRIKCVGSSDIGRYPANVVHDGSDEVMEAFAAFGEKTSGKPCGVRRAKYAFGSTEETGTPLTGFGDTRTAARFFYCAKSSKSERNAGLDCDEIIEVELSSLPQGCTSWESQVRKARLRVDTAPSPPRVIEGCGVPFSDASAWSMFLFGSNITGQSPPECRFTTKTKTNSITSSATLSWLTRSPTSAFTVDANSETECGGNRARSAESCSPSVSITLARTASLPGVGSVPSGARLKISGNVAPAHNFHATVKPLSLMRWMVRLVTPEGGRVLDPFAGSGSTLVAAQLEGRDAVGVELDWAHCEIIKRRLAAAVVPEDLGLFQGV